MIKQYEGICCFVSKLDWFPALLTRLSLGYVFIRSGWMKFINLHNTSVFFSRLGIPLPGLNAPLVAGTEFLCGIMILLGLFTRIASLPLIFILIIAIITAKFRAVQDLSQFFCMFEYLFIVLFLWLVVKGAGALSIDRLIEGECRSKSSDEPLQ